MNIKKIEKLINMPEGMKLDFKRDLILKYDSDKKEFAKDVSAIANSRGGRGYIIFGIEDNTKEIVGVEIKDFDEERLQQVIGNRIDPPIPIRVEIEKYKGKQIVILTIFNSDQKPHQMKGNGKFYIRRGSTTDYARRHEIANIMQEYGLVNFETTIMNNLTERALDKKLVSMYLKRSFKHITDDEKYLLSALGILKQDISTGHFHPTAGGLLLFGKNPQVFLPHTGIRIQYNNQKEYVRGNILKLINVACIKVKEILNDEKYPIKAVEQAVSNAVIHRDYWDCAREIEINITDKYIDITNPGSQISINNQSEFLIYRRNPWLYDRMLVIDKKGRFLKHGRGINKIKKTFKYSEEVKFINNIEDNVYRVILPR